MSTEMQLCFCKNNIIVTTDVKSSSHHNPPSLSTDSVAGGLPSESTAMSVKAKIRWC